MDENLLPESRELRIPVSHRFAPAASFALTVLGGALSAWWILQLFNSLKNDKTATVKGLMNGIASVGQSIGLLYSVAALIGIVSIVVLRMRSDEDEPVLPAPAYIMGLPSMISPLLSSYAMYIVIAAFHSPAKLDFGKLGADVAQFLVISFIASAVAFGVLLIFIFVPLSARVGKRLSPVVAIALITAGVAALACISFWLVGFSQEPTNPIFGA